MGADLDVVHGFIEARVTRLSGAQVVLEFPSNGATENLLTAAVLAKGHTVIENAAREPEITELAATLNRMGANVLGAGTSTIEIDGVESLTPVDVELIGDRIEAGTLLMACGIAGGEITIEGARLEHLELVAMKLGEMGLKVSPTPDGIWARADERLRAVDVATLPFPGFATDFMPQVVALLATRRRHVDRHRERVRQPAQLRRRARADGRRRAPRGPPRGDPRRPPTLGCAGAGARRARRRGAGARRARRRGRDRSCSTRGTSTAATPTSPPPCRRSGPTSPGPGHEAARAGNRPRY